MCEMVTGFVLCSMVSIVVWSPACEQSIRIPRRFIRSTALRPKAVRPESRASLSPQPRAFASL